MPKIDTYATATPVLTDYVLGTDDPGGTPLTKNFTFDAINTLFEANVSGAYGIMSVQAGVTGEPTVDATPRKIEAWNTDGAASGVTVDSTTGNDLTIVLPGTYVVWSSVSFSGSATDDYQIEIYKNGGATGFALDRKLGTGGDTGSASVVGIISAVATDTIELYQSSSSGGTAMTISEAQFVAVRVAS